MKKLIIAATICLASTSVWSQSVSDVLNLKLSSLQEKLGSGSPETMAINAYHAKARDESFAIQAIARIFDKENNIFKDLKKDAKALEDHFGQIDKWDVLGNKLMMEKELKSLSDYLQESNIKSRLQYYSQKITSLNISEADTKKIVVDGIKDEIHDIMKKEYDFTYGETGLHELRRNTRWIVMELDVFKGHFTTKKTSCPATFFYNIGKGPFITVIENPKASFEIGYCSYVETIGVVTYLGNVKDDLEKKGLLDKKVSPEIMAISKETLKELRQNILKGLL